LESKASPAQICQQIKLCSSSVNEFEDEVHFDVENDEDEEDDEEMYDDVDEEFDEEDEQKMPPVKNFFCSACSRLIGQVESQLGDNNTLGKVTALINKACQTLGVTAFCQAKLLPRISTILKSIQKKDPPKNVCAKLRVCNATKPAPPPPVNIHEEHFNEEDYDDEAFEGLDIKCSACKEVMHLTEGFVTGDHSQAAIQKAVSRACGQVPFASEICKSIAGSLVSKVSQDLANKLDPKAICIKVKFCKA